MLDTSIRPPDKWRAAAIPKKDGSLRYLLIPNDELKQRQREILDYLYKAHLRVHEAAVGFMPNKCTLNGCLQHAADAQVIINLDVHDFFPSFPVDKVRSVLTNQLGAAVADYIVDIATFKGKHRQQLPQGAPTSPYLTNIALYKFDCNMAANAKRRGFTYTRYADDITLASSSEMRVNYIKTLIHGTERRLRALGLTLSRKKTNVIFRNSPRVPRRITGVTVRKDGFGFNAPIGLRKQARAMIHNLYTALKSGVPAQELVPEYCSAMGTVQYCDFIRSASIVPEYATADPNIKTHELEYIKGVFRAYRHY